MLARCGLPRRRGPSRSPRSLAGGRAGLYPDSSSVPRRDSVMPATRGELFAGVTVALVTPFRGGDIDWDDLGKLVDWHADQGTHGLVPCGTTGESPTLDHDEHERVVAFVCERARGRLKVMAGTGSNSTREAIRMTKAAKRAGATGTL